MKKFVSVLMLVLVVAAFAVLPAFAQRVDPTAGPSVSAVVLQQPAGPAFHTQEGEPPAGGVTLPSELQALVAMFVGFIVTQGLKSFSKLLGADLSGWGAAISASLVTAATLFINALLSAVPATAQPSVAVALSLVVTILGAFGVHATIKGFQPKAK